MLLKPTHNNFNLMCLVAFSNPHPQHASYCVSSDVACSMQEFFLTPVCFVILESSAVAFAEMNSLLSQWGCVPLPLCYYYVLHRKILEV